MSHATFTVKCKGCGAVAHVNLVGLFTVPDLCPACRETPTIEIQEQP